MILAFQFLNVTAFTQTFPGYVDLRENADPDAIRLHAKDGNVFNDRLDTVDYVKTLLYTWKLMKLDSGAFQSGRLLQALSFVGDMQSVLRFSAKKLSPYPQLHDTAYLNRFSRDPFKYADAREFVLREFRSHDVIMFNEAHDRPQTRAFVLSLLADLKKAGASCLAMETLDENGDLNSLNWTTGHYTREPVGGEVVRTALRLGYRLVAYEDRNTEHTSGQRDSVQAVKLYDRIKKPGGVEKTVVLAGYGHISEGMIGDFVPMAMNFAKISGIDPLTVEQTLLLEDMEISAYANKLITKILATDRALAFTGDAVRFGIDTSDYDILIYHPPTRYIHHRPAWLLNKPGAKFFPIAIPDGINPVLVQAYYSTEIETNRDYFSRVPADQTFYAEDNLVWLVLSERVSYNIVFRGQKNEILHKMHVKVR